MKQKLRNRQSIMTLLNPSGNIPVYSLRWLDCILNIPISDHISYQTKQQNGLNGCQPILRFPAAGIR